MFLWMYITIMLAASSSWLIDSSAIFISSTTDSYYSLFTHTHTKINPRVQMVAFQDSSALVITCVMDFLHNNMHS